MFILRGWELGLRGNNEIIFLLEVLLIKEVYIFKEGDCLNLFCIFFFFVWYLLLINVFYFYVFIINDDGFLLFIVGLCMICF